MRNLAAEKLSSAEPRSQTARLSELRAARTGRRLDDAIRIARVIIERNGSTVARRIVARTLTELNRHEEAAPHWAALHTREPGDPEAAFRVAWHAIRRGAPLDAALAQSAAGNNEIFCNRMRQALLVPLPGADDSLHHIAICGVSFCGSTLLDRILGGLPGSRSIGESHWLTKEYDSNRYAALDISREMGDPRPSCTVCGPSCAVLTRDFRVALSIDPSRWYFRIAHRLGAATLISSDKNVPKLIDQDPLLRFSALVVFKSPEQAWISHRAKLPQDSHPEYYAQELETYLSVWNRSYRELLHELNPAGGKLFLWFDAFTRKPHAILKAMCRSLAVDFDSRVLERTKPGHAIGGNEGTVKRFRQSDYGVSIERLHPGNLPAREKDRIRKDAQLQECFRGLSLEFNRWASRSSQSATTREH